MRIEADPVKKRERKRKEARAALERDCPCLLPLVIAVLCGERDPEDLRAVWQELRARHPEAD